MIAKQTAMPSQVAEALARLEWLATSKNTHDAINTLRAELHRLTEIAEGYDGMVIRLHDVTTELEKANALLIDVRETVANCMSDYGVKGGGAIVRRINEHLKGACDEAV